MPSEPKQQNLCSSCFKYPVKNQHFKLCAYCNQKRLNETKKPRKPIKQSSRGKESASKKKTLKNQLLDQRGSVCSGCQLQARGLTLSHTIPVSLRKDLELDPENCHLECMDCHTAWEHGSLDRKKKLLNYESKIEYIKQVDYEYFNRKFSE